MRLEWLVMGEIEKFNFTTILFDHVATEVAVINDCVKIRYEHIVQRVFKSRTVGVESIRINRCDYRASND